MAKRVKNCETAWYSAARALRVAWLRGSFVEREEGQMGGRSVGGMMSGWLKLC